MSLRDRQYRGAVSYQAGKAAEDSVARAYQRRGYRLAAQRWRGAGGEIDLIFRQDDRFVFVEVKSGPDWARAAQRVTSRQARRLMASAQDFVGQQTGTIAVDMRLDVALVDGQGRIEIVENAFM